MTVTAIPTQQSPLSMTLHQAQDIGFQLIALSKAIHLHVDDIHNNAPETPQVEGGDFLSLAEVAIELGNQQADLLVGGYEGDAECKSVASEAFGLACEIESLAKSINHMTMIAGSKPGFNPDDLLSLSRVLAKKAAQQRALLDSVA